jgi:hypothetical protein
MSAALHQIINPGVQDAYLTGTPQITYFKLQYKRHTNFAMESIEQTVNSFEFGRDTLSVNVSRNADLVYSGYMEVTLPVVTAAGAGNTPVWNNGVGYKLFKKMELLIGGQTIETQYGEWMQIYNELSVSGDLRAGLNTMVGSVDVAGSAATEQALRDNNIATAAKTLLVPLQFYFNRNPGLALPIVALQYHEINIKFSTTALNKLCHAITAANAPVGDTLTAPSPAMKMYLDYIYLGSEERQALVNSKQEILFEQVQQLPAGGSQATASTTAFGSGSASVNLDFNHPVKELVWFHRLDSNSGGDSSNAVYCASDNWTGGVGSNYSANLPTSTHAITFSGSDRVKSRGDAYYNLLQPNQHHTRVPTLPGLGMYSFALRPEEHQPSGTANFSRIDTAKLTFTGSAATFPALGAVDNVTVTVYAVNYNVLRVSGGVGGTAYN